MCGFDNDWRCPNHQRENGEMDFCPAGGCAKGCCAIDQQKTIELLTGVKPPLEAVHVG